MLDRRLAVDQNLVFNAPLRQLDGATFMSRDQNGISCANSLAKWQLKSLLWDGADSVVNCGKDLRIANIFDGGGTVSAWIKAKSDGEGSLGRIFDKWGSWMLLLSDETGGKVKVQFGMRFSDEIGWWKNTSAIVPIKKWNYIAISYDSGNVANNPIIYVNGIAYTIGDGLAENQAPVGTRVSDTNYGLYIGNNNDSIYNFDGNMTDMHLYNRILSGIEIARIYNRTKRFFC